MKCFTFTYSPPLFKSCFIIRCLLATVDIAVLICAFAARFCVNFAFNIGLQYAAELLPTVIRAQVKVFSDQNNFHLPPIKIS